MVGGFGFRILNPSDYKRYYDGYCICKGYYEGITSAWVLLAV